MADMDAISVSVPDLSTAILPDANHSHFGHATEMDLDVILQNLERLLKAKGRSADAVSKAAGVPDAIRNIKRTMRGKIKAEPTLRTIAALAKELGVTVNDLQRPQEQIDVQAVPGVRAAILQKLEWLEQQRQQAFAELAALDLAEIELRKPPKRKNR